MRQGEPSVGKETTSGTRQSHARTVALEKRYAELVFQHADPPTDGGRIEPEMLRRAPETAGLGDSDEDLEVSQLHQGLTPNHPRRLTAGA